MFSYKEQLLRSSGGPG